MVIPETVLRAKGSRLATGMMVGGETIGVWSLASETAVGTATTARRNLKRAALDNRHRFRVLQRRCLLRARELDEETWIWF
jgi:hypothetical protein